MFIGRNVHVMCPRHAAVGVFLRTPTHPTRACSFAAPAAMERSGAFGLSRAAPPARGPVTVLWDYENCPAPAAERAYIDGTTIVERLCSEFLKFGPIVEVKTFGNVSTIRAALREELQTSAVTVIDAQSVDKRKDLVDKMIFTHMFCFALDHPPPATIVLISGDVDYALPLAMLKLRLYHIVLVKPSGRNVNPKLLGIAHEIYDWEDLLFPERLAGDLSDATPAPAHHPRAPQTHHHTGTKDGTPPERSPAAVRGLKPGAAHSTPVPAKALPTAEHAGHDSAATIPASPAVKVAREARERADSSPKEVAAAAATVLTSVVAPPAATQSAAPATPSAPATPATPGAGEKPHRVLDAHAVSTPSRPLAAPAVTRDPSDSDGHSEDDVRGCVSVVVCESDVCVCTGLAGLLTSPQASSLSEVAARIHLRDFIYVLTELHTAGDQTPLLTKVGSRLHERYPKLFSKGTLARP